MRLITRPLFLLLILASASACVLAQVRDALRSEKVESSESRSTTAAAIPERESSERASASDPQNNAIWISLTDGRRIQVDEVSETKDGVWYKRGIVSEFVERGRIKRIERSEDVNPSADEIIRGSGNWSLAAGAKIDSFFVATFARHLPLTAYGQSELHTRWGLDHHQGMDVGLHPDSLEGQALIAFLRREAIPFLAFRRAIPGVATGPHIHIGNASHRLFDPRQNSNSGVTGGR
ncbi:MAG TPA: hypothetical protein VIV66_10025 [Pyrinomonadaceae bacterium]